MGAMGRPCLICQPSSRTGENPPYGMIGGTVETSASFEARYAPLSYPTAGGDPRWSSLPRQQSTRQENALFVELAIDTTCQQILIRSRPQSRPLPRGGRSPEY